MKKNKILVLAILLFTFGLTGNLMSAALSSVVINEDNTQMIITFDAAVSASDVGQVPLDIADLAETFTANGSGAVITSWGTVTFTHEYPWTQVTADLIMSEAGGIVTGLENIAIDVAAASVYDSDTHVAIAVGTPVNDYCNNTGAPVILSAVINTANTEIVVTFDKGIIDQGGGPVISIVDVVAADFVFSFVDGGGSGVTLLATLPTGCTMSADHTVATLTYTLVTPNAADGLEVLTVGAVDNASIFGPDGSPLLAASTLFDNINRKNPITMYVNNLIPLEYETIDGEDPSANTQIMSYTSGETDVWVNTDLSGSYQANDVIEVISGTGDKSYAMIKRFDSVDSRHIYLNAAFTGGAAAPVNGDELNFVDLTSTVTAGPLAAQPFKYLSTALGVCFDGTEHSTYVDHELIANGDILIVADGSYENAPYSVNHAVTIKKADATVDADYSNFSPVFTSSSNVDIFDVAVNVEVKFLGITIMCKTGTHGIDVTTWTALTGSDGITCTGSYFYNAGAGGGFAINGSGTDDLGTRLLKLVVDDVWWNSAAGNIFTAEGAIALINGTFQSGTVTDILGDQVVGDTNPTGGEFRSGEHGQQATFDLLDGINDYDIKITPNAFPWTDPLGAGQAITVNRWNCTPPGRGVYTPPYDGYYFRNSYFEVSLGTPALWPDRKWEADVIVYLATGLTYDSMFEDVQLMRWEDYGESFTGWVTVSGATLIDGDVGSDYLTFRINREGVYCFVRPNSPTTNFGVYIGETTSGLAAASEQPNYLLYPNANELTGGVQWAWPDNSGLEDDWDVSNYETSVTFHISPTEALELSQVDMLLHWDADYLQFQTFTWGNIFTGGSSSNRYYEILGSNNGIRVTGSILGYNSDDNVTSPAGTEIDFFTLVFKMHKPGYTPIYFEYVDVRKFATTDGYIDKRFSIPYDAAYINRLGDVRSIETNRQGDGLINTYDLADWTLAYWSGVSGSQTYSSYYRYKFDIGPTDNNRTDGWPIRDGDIEFEDLIIFSMNYQVTAEGGQMVRSDAPPIGPTIKFGEELNTRSDVEIPIIIEGPVSDFRAGSFKINYNHELLEFKGARKGELLENSGTTFMKAQEINDLIWCDMAVLGGDARAINQPGELVVLEFDRLNYGNDYELVFADMDLRNSLNNNMIPEEPNPEFDIPTHFNLSQNFPNPFVGNTTIKYQVPKSANVNLNVYNIKGQKVATLVDGLKDPGYFTVDFDASNLANGLYFYRIIAGDYVKTNKMLIIR